MANQFFINIKNEKIYRLVDFARRKQENGSWQTEIAYQPEESGQIYIRKVDDFFSKFIPKNCWDTATEKQKKEMKGKLGANERFVPFTTAKTVYPEDKREYIDLKDYTEKPHLICHRDMGVPKHIYEIFDSKDFKFDVHWDGGFAKYFNPKGIVNGEHQFYLNPEYLND